MGINPPSIDGFPESENVNTAVTKVSEKEKRKDFVFVVGCPRSGTYLLVSALNSTGSVAIPIETHFVPLFDRVKCLWGDLSHVNNRTLLCESICDFLEIWNAYAKGDRDAEKLKKCSLLAVRSALPSIVSSSSSYSELVGAFFSAYAVSQDAEIAGDKSAFFNHMPMERLADVVSGAKFIHIVRDGRDVCLSWRRTWFGPKTVFGAARLWTEHVRKKREWGVENGDSYIDLKYEDFLGDPDLKMEKIKKFLQLSVDDHKSSWMDDGFAQMLSEEQSHSLLAKPIDSSNKDKWRTEMSRRECDLFEYVAGKELAFCGYETRRKGFSFFEHVYFCAVIAVSWFRDLVSFRNVRLVVKSLLPVVIFVARKCDRPLPGLLKK